MAFWDAQPQAWLAAIVDSSDDAIVGKTLDSVIRTWNRSATRMFGYAPEEIIGRPVTTLMPPELQFEEANIVARLARGERVDPFETTRLRKDGSRIEVSLSVSPIREPSGGVVGAAKVARDITEARRLRKAEQLLIAQLQDLSVELEQQLEESRSLQDELEHANEELGRLLQVADDARRVAEEANAAKSRFLATMSHELRTPLNAIGGYVDLLDMELRGPISAEQREDLLRIRRSGDTLRRLIDDLLNFARIEAGRLEYHYREVALAEFLAGLETFIAPRVATKGIRYRFIPDGCLITVSIDRDKVEQILLNLLSNAVKFTETGDITIRCDIGQDRFLVHVIDTGPGVPASMQESIFEPFVQGDQSLTRTAEGAGLGLAICRQLARAMGGDVRVQSREGAGSTFTLELPRKH